MKNKILVLIYVPTIHEEFEIFLPTNENIKRVINIIIKTINNLVDGGLKSNNNYCLIDPETSIIYDFNLLVRETNIRNNKRLILI